MAKGTQYSKQFKEDAVRYRKDHPELTIRKAADNLGISESALKSWMKAAKENDGSVPTRGTGNYSSDEAKEIARLQRELRDTKDALEILKKAFGNNLNIGYLNTLSNTEEEKFITLINKYCSEKEKSNSKLNEKIKELVKDIPINYRLALDLYLGFYDGKKYTVDELSLILNLPAYEIKTRIKNGIIYIKNILKTKDLESQKELNALIKSL